MFRLSLLRRILPMALSICMVTQSIPSTVYAAEYTESGIEETSETEVLKTDVSEETEGVSEATQTVEIPETVTAEAEAEKISEGTFEEAAAETSEISAEEGTTLPENSETSEQPATREETAETLQTPEGTEEELTSSEASKETVTEQAATQEQTAEEETVSEEETEVETTEENFELKSAEDTEITLDNPIDVTLEYGNEQWYYFTATEDGNYNFYAQNDTYNYAYVYLYESKEASYYIKYENDYDVSMVQYLSAGATVWLKLCTYNSDGLTLSLGVRKIAQNAVLTTTDDGYLAENDEVTVSIKPTVGYKTVTLDIDLDVKEGVTADSVYKIKTYYKKVGSQGTSSNVSYLYSNSGYQSTIKIAGLDMAHTYEITMHLLDYSTGEIVSTLISDSSPVQVTTQQTDQKIVFYDSAVTYRSVQFNLEAIETVSYIEYALAADPDTGVQMSQYVYGAQSVEISKLEPETEYSFKFYNYNYELLAEKTETTLAFPGTAAYEVTSTSADAITLSAELSEYSGIEGYCYFYYEVFDADKNSVYKSYSSKAVSSGSASFSVTVSNLLASTEYTVKVWFQEGDSRLEEQEYSVTTQSADFSAEDISLELRQDEEVPTRVNYNITIEGYTDSVSGTLQYRIKGAQNSFTSKTISVNSGESSGTLTGLQQGAEYEFVLFLGGVKKETTFTCGEAAIVPKMSDDTDAFDSILTYQLDVSEIDEDATYTVRAYYYNGSAYTSLGSSNTLDADNSYTATVKTGASVVLVPDTEYSIQWKLSVSGTSTTQYTYYQSIHTTEGSVSIVQSNIFLDQAGFDLTLNGRTENLTQSLTLYSYLKEGEGAFKKRANSIYLSASNSYEQKDYYLNGLKENTTYELSLRDNNEIEYGSISFTIPADDRAVSVSEATAELHTFSLTATVTGTVSSRNNYLLLYYREKGTENAWESSSRYLYDTVKTAYFDVENYNNVELKEDTTYEYAIGFGSTYNTSMDSLKAVIKGEVTTKKDTRTLTLSGVDSGYTFAEIDTTLSGNSYNVYSYIYTFYREKGALEWIQNNSYSATSSINEKQQTYVTELSAGTVYEYAIVVSDSYNGVDTPDAVTDTDRKVTGEVTTKKSDYTLSFEAVEEKCTSSKEVVRVTANGTADDVKLDVLLTLDNGQQQTVSLKQKSDYINTVTFTDLLAEQSYTIVSAVIKTTETINNSTVTVQIAEMEPDYAFITKKAEVPTGITLSKEELKLNLLYDEGTQLKAAVQPAGASADVIWSSSNEEVAFVEDGIVYAQGVGEAVITAASVYDAKVTAECKVTVKNYVAAITSSTDITPVYGGYGIRATKGKVHSNIGYYEYSEDGNLTPVSEYNVTSNKPGVAYWQDNALVGAAVGTTDIIFEKDGYQASIFVSVVIEAKGFGIVGLTASDSRYPAIQKADDTYEIAYSGEGTLSYQAVGMINPKNETFTASDFTWTSSDSTVAAVEDGIITPLKAGNATITVKSVSKEFTDVNEISFKLEVKELPVEDTPTVYAVTNVQKKLADVPFPETWGDGWSWKEPQTLLYNIPVNSDYYTFEAVYTGDSYYAYEGAVNVYMSTITGVYTSEAGTHRNVLMADGSDAFELSVSPSYMGVLSASAYTTNIPDVSGLTIKKDEQTGTYTVTTQKAGKYTLKPQIIVNGSVVATGSFTFTAVTESPIASIKLTSATEEVSISDNLISFDLGDEKTFELNAAAVDRAGNENTATKLQWNITDKSVAALKVDKDTRKATVTVKGEGHAVIEVTAKDAAGVSTQMKLEIKNHKPRVDGSKATINKALDYSVSSGKTLSRNLYGAIEIVPVYGESILNVSVVNEDGTASEQFGIYNVSYNYYIVIPKSEEIAAGTYKCSLAVSTAASAEPYQYPLTVQVIDKKPKVSAKITKSMNLFYVLEKGQAEITLENSLYSIEDLVWEDASGKANSGFEYSYWGSYAKKPNVKIYNISQEHVKVKNGALVDNVAVGTLKIKLVGVKEEYTFNNFKIKYSYKKPTLKTVDANTGKNVSNIVPAISNGTRSRFYLYDNLAKSYLYYQQEADMQSSNYYDELSYDNENVVITQYNYNRNVDFNYLGEKSTETLALTVDSVYWREALTVKHTIKVLQPKAVLSGSALTFNTNYMNEVSTSVVLKDYYRALSFTDIAISGADAKSAALLADDRLQLIHSGYSVLARVNKLKLAGQSIPNGSYSFNLTPYYTDQATGEKKALNTLKLKITFTDKAATAKVSAKGTIDLAQTPVTTPSLNSVAMTAKFSNLGTKYKVIDAQLSGEYSKYFMLVKNSYDTSYNPVYYLKIANAGKLKAGQTYNVAITYTIQTTGGETFTVVSNKVKVKPKQTAPKITVAGNGQTLYAAANLSRTYTISAPNSSYSITSASGSIDVNKDGKADIQVSLNRSSGRYGYLTVRIVDADAVLASASGKSYSIPVTVQVKGRDGISKDASVSVKVKVKR